MASTPVGSNALIQEVLDRSNYSRWRLRVQTYLLSEDLWDVVEGVTEPPKLEDDQAGYKSWTKRNAKALYAIQNSCGPEMFSFISKTGSAKTAWEALKQEVQEMNKDMNKLDKNKFHAGLNMDSYDHRLRYESFLKYVSSGNWDKAKKCLGEVDLRSVVVVKDLVYVSTALHEAAGKGHVHIVKDLVRLLTPEDWKTTNTDSGHTALHVAALYGHVHVVKELPVKVMGEVQDKDGDTALHNAVSAGKLDVVQELVRLMRQEDLQIKNHDGYTALHLAVNKGDMPMVKELVRNAKGENNIENKQDFEPFTSYVRTFRRDKANECLGKLSDDPCGALTAAVKSRGYDGSTALHVAAWMGHLHVIKGLLSTWQKMRERNLAEDFTRYGSVITEELLMERAKCMVEQYESSLGFLEIQDDGGCTALYMAVNRNNLDIVKELAPMMRQEGLELTEVDFSRSALHEAVLYEGIDIVKELVPLMRKEGLEVKDDDGNTLLNCAIIKGNVDVVKELVHSMRPEGFEVKNYRGCNALHQAVVKGDMHIVKELMIPLMPPNALEEKDHQGFTALGQAIRIFNDEDVCKIAKYMHEKNKSVFGIPSTGPEDDDEIPVIQALRLNRWELARYLYKLTPPQVLNGTDGSAFLCYCFDRKQFDLAWDLLRRYPYLGVLGKDKFSPMLKLSRMSYAFLSGKPTDELPKMDL